MSRVLIIVPAYNEAESIGGLLAQLREQAAGFDVAVVDDGSTDATADVVRTYSGVTLLRLPFNLGIGGGVQTGFKYALRCGYDIAVQCDGDGQHPVDRIADLVRRVEDGTADVIIGSRYVADSDYAPSFSRRVGKSMLSRWVNMFIGGGITDTTSGFRAMNRRALEVFARTYPEDYPEPEALVILHRCGLRAAEVPVNMRPRQGGETSIKAHRALYYMLKVGMAIFVDLFRRFEPRKGAAR